MICQKCGKQNPAGSVFCLSCGEKLADTVKSSDGLYFIEKCPVLMVSHSIIKDMTADTVSLQCEFQNLSQKNIIALYISVLCAGIDGGEVQGIDEYVYLDMTAVCGAMFGGNIKIPLPNRAARKITIAPRKVVFENSDVWNNDTRFFEALQTSSLDMNALGEFADVYKRAVPQRRQKCLPQRNNTYWQCGCGQVNLPDETRCVSCNEELISQLKLLDKNILNQLRERFRAADETDEAEKEKKRKLKFIAFIGICAVTVALFLTLVILALISQ
jgi:hypothetical protein